MNLFNRFFNKQFTYIRYKDGTNWASRLNETLASGDLLEIALNNPVLSAVIDIRANYLSKFKFYIEEPNGEKNFEAKELDLINQPNIYQSTEDFLKQYEWLRCSYGWVYQKPFGSKGFEPNALYNLSPKCISFDSNNKPYLIWRSKDIKDQKDLTFKYLDNQTEKTFKFSEIIPFYDIANGLKIDNNDSQYTSPSRIHSILKQVSNINLAGEAENVITQTNGREAIYSKEVKQGQFVNDYQPLTQEDKDNLQRANTQYSMRLGDKRTMFPSKPIEHLDMSINAKNLGLHELITNNAGLVVQMYGLNNAIYKYFLKGDTFNNQDSAEVRFLQNTMQPVADDLANSWTKSFGDINRPFKATVNHVPTMQVVEERRAEKALKITTAIKNLVSSGYSAEEATQFINNLGVDTNE